MREFVTSVLLFELIFGPLFSTNLRAVPRQAESEEAAKAEEEELTKATENYPASLKAAIRLKEVKDTRQLLPLTADEVNLNHMLYQSVIDNKTGREDSVSIYNLSVPNYDMPPGYLEYAMKFRKIAGGLEFFTKNSRYTHRVLFKTSTTSFNVLNTAQDSDNFYLLLSNRQWLAIPFTVIQYQFAKGAIPFFVIDDASKSLIANRGQANKIHINRRRFIPIDKSRKPQAAKLDLSEETLEGIKKTKNPETIAALRENLEKVRPIPYHADITFDEKGQERPYKAFDVSIVGEVKGQEVILQDYDLGYINAQISLQISYLLALSKLSNPLDFKAFADLQRLGPTATLELEELFKDNEKLVELATDRSLLAVSTLKAEGLLSAQSRANTLLSYRMAELKNQVSPRDSWSKEEGQNDHAILKDAIDTGEIYAKEPWFKKLKDTVKQKASNVNPMTPLRYAANLLKTREAIILGGGTAALYAYDQATHRGQLAADFMMAVASFSQRNFAVLHDPEYRNVLALSTVYQLAALAACYGAGVLTKPFGQGTVAQNIFQTTIRLYIRVFQTPISRLLAYATSPASTLAFNRRYPQLRAMEKGYISPRWLPSLKKEREDKITEDKIAQDTVKKALVAAVVLQAVAMEKNILPGQLFQFLAGDKENVEEAQKLTLTLLDYLENFETDVIQKIVNGNKEYARELLEKLRPLAEGAKALQDDLGKSFGTRKTWLKEVAEQRVVQMARNLGEPVYIQAANAVPNQFVANLAMQTTLVDMVVTIGAQGISGDMADLNKPTKLVAQRDSFGMTHPTGWTAFGEQVVGHTGPGATNLHLSLSKEATRSFVENPPAALVDSKLKDRSRGFLIESLHFMKHVMDWRNNNPFVLFGKMNLKRRVIMFRATLLTALPPRIFLGGQAVGAAFLGQLYFMFMAPLQYGYPWIPQIQGASGLEDETHANKMMVEDLIARLDLAVRNQDKKELLRLNEIAREMYRNPKLSLSQEVKEKIKPLMRANLFAEAEGYKELLIQEPPIPTIANQNVMRSTLGVVGVSTTVLWTYLMTRTMDHENPLTVSEVLVSAAAGLGIIYGIGQAGHGFNYLWDKFVRKDKVSTEKSRQELRRTFGLTLFDRPKAPDEQKVNEQCLSAFQK